MARTVLHNFNPRTPCGVRQAVEGAWICEVSISIHAPLAGCDNRTMLCGSSWLNFNPRTPCGVRRWARTLLSRCLTHFNPRTPCGVRRSVFSNPARRWRHFNPRTPCGVRRQANYTFRWQHVISIHAPLAGCDRISSRNTVQNTGFQSTHPLRGATALDQWYDSMRRFQSTHPLRGATRRRSGLLNVKQHFNPRTPCGVRLIDAVTSDTETGISIHAPLAGCDQTMCAA